MLSIDHIQITVKDMSIAEPFYDRLMPILGFDLEKKIATNQINILRLRKASKEEIQQAEFELEILLLERQKQLEDKAANDSKEGQKKKEEAEKKKREFLNFFNENKHEIMEHIATTCPAEYELIKAMVLPVFTTSGSNLNSIVCFPAGICNPLKT